MVAVKAEGRTADSHFKTIEAQQDTMRERNGDARSRGPTGRADRGRR
jgi:hypothetical protein